MMNYAGVLPWDEVLETPPEELTNDYYTFYTHHFGPQVEDGVLSLALGAVKMGVLYGPND